MGPFGRWREASKAGLAVWRDRVPIREETVLICQHLGLDPLGLISSGTMLLQLPGAKNWSMP